MAVDFDKLHRELSETEMALFTGVTLAMFSAIEAGANPRNLIARLGHHQGNFTALRQPRAAELVEAFAAMVSTTIPR